MDKKPDMVGWYCCLDYVGKDLPRVKGKIIEINDYGVTLIEDNTNKEIFAPWYQIDKIEQRQE